MRATRRPQMHRLKNWQLFVICVLTWGTTWYAITFQLGHTGPEVGVALRFALAGMVVLALCVVRGMELRFPPGDHALLALQGIFLYGVSYVCVYHAEQHLVSGLVAVGYSASPLVVGLGADALFGQRVTARFVTGGLLGIVGVALMFWTEFGKAADVSADVRRIAVESKAAIKNLNAPAIKKWLGQGAQPSDTVLHRAYLGRSRYGTCRK